MRCFFLLILVLSVASSGFAQSNDEKKALSQFVESWPLLAPFLNWTVSGEGACTPPGFHGVECTLINGEYHVSAINLDFDDPEITSVAGVGALTLPKDIGGLLWLEQLHMIQSCFEGSLPPSLSQLQQLRSLRLKPCTSNVFEKKTGLITDLPAGLIALPNLEVLTIWANRFIGTFPDSLPPESPLQILDLRSKATSKKSSLEGTMPQSLANLQHLKRFKLLGITSEIFSNETTFNWPSLVEFTLIQCTNAVLNLDNLAIGAPSLQQLFYEASNPIHSLIELPRLVNLTRIQISSHNDYPDYIFYPTLPDAFWRLTNLEQVSFQDAPILGSIHPDIKFMQKLSILNLSFRRLKGTIPEEIGDCASLMSIYLQSVPSLSGTLPKSICNLSQLIDLRITESSVEGDIPAEIGFLSQLRELSLISNRFNGTIPSSLGYSRSLFTLDLSFNLLHGKIPDFHHHLSTLNLQNNRLTGTIPLSVTNAASVLYLNNNELGPELDPNLFINSSLIWAFLSYNRFNDYLPDVGPHFQVLHIASNAIVGSIPSSYCSLNELDLSDNVLLDRIDALLQPDCCLTSILLRDNLLNGTIGSLSSTTSLLKLDLARNSFTGSVPAIPSQLVSLNLAANMDLYAYDDFYESILNSSLSYLELSNNHFDCPIKPSLLSSVIAHPSLAYISLASNEFKCYLGGIVMLPNSSLSELNLSNNSFFGSFPLHGGPALIALDLSYNRFTNWLNVRHGLSSFPVLTELDISHNIFNFDFALLSGAPFLKTLNIEDNEIRGTIKLVGLPSLEKVNLDWNVFHRPVDLVSIGFHMKYYALQHISIQMNPSLPTINSFDTNATGLDRTRLVSPSATGLKGAVCHRLAFFGLVDRTFLFDESLFDFLQCECDAAHFGMPPYGCQKCPSNFEACGGPNLNVSSNSFVFSYFDDSTSAFKLETEPCAYTPVQQLLQKYKCEGLNISATLSISSNLTEAELLNSQCKEGAEGRLCSKCRCSSDGPCYFDAQTFCRRCHRTFKPSESAIFAIGMLLLIVVVATGIMFAILRSKRTKSTIPWANLPLYKRIFHRFLFMTTLGNVSILVAFLQILAELTHWDSYFIGGVLGLVKGSIDGFGLRCVFPFLAHPLASLLGAILLPTLVIALLGISISLAEFLARILARKSRPNHSLSHSTSERSDGASTWLLLHPTHHNYVPYPAMALFTSTSLSVIKFFYFGTAIAAHEYIFPSSQPYTHTKYVQNQPWMKYDDALSLIAASVPAMIIFDFVLPFSFIVLCWKVRDTYDSVGVQVYFGSMFESFSRRCFWWEIVNILRKLTIALVLQGLPSNSAIQSALVLSVVSGTMVVQVSLSPWKRGIENIFDTISSVLLIASLHVSRTAHLSHVEGVNYYLLVLESLFTASSVLVIIVQTLRGSTAYHLQLLRLSDGAPQVVTIIDADLPENESHLMSDDDDGALLGAKLSKLQPLQNGQDSEEDFDEM